MNKIQIRQPPSQTASAVKINGKWYNVSYSEIEEDLTQGENYERERHQRISETKTPSNSPSRAKASDELKKEYEPLITSDGKVQYSSLKSRAIKKPPSLNDRDVDVIPIERPAVKSLKKTQEIIEPPKKIGVYKKALSIPLQYERSMDELMKVEDFIESNDLWNLIDYDTPEDYHSNGGILLEKLEFNELKQMIFVFGQIMEDIDDIDNHIITKGKVTKPTQKVKTVLKISKLYL